MEIKKEIKKNEIPKEKEERQIQQELIEKLDCNAETARNFERVIRK
ncbi:MAG: hypothetical protein QXI95_02295 [Candidatus Micrarchaeaceae archaeon]